MSVGPKAVVFDCDGVLVDSEKAWFVGIVNVFERKGIHELVTGPASDLYGASVGDVVAFLERELGQSLDHEEATREVYDAILEAIDEGVVAIEGAIGLLEEIGARARLRWPPTARSKPSRPRCGPLTSLWSSTPSSP